MVPEEKYLLSTRWTQYGKVISCGSNETLKDGIDFNQYMPFGRYQAVDTRSYTGCVTTASAQIIYYHLQNDFLNDDIAFNIRMDILSEQDAYVSYANIPEFTIYIPADGSETAGILSFAEINEKLAVFVPAPADPHDRDYDLNSLAAADYIAALNFSVGIMLKSNYTSFTGTGTEGSEKVFLKCGFESAHYVDPDEMDEIERSLWVTENFQLTDEAIEILIENMENGTPVMFQIPGHAIVLDGYDNETDLFHLNYGWGPDDFESGTTTTQDQKNSRWYTREEFKQLGNQGFVIDISPVYQETFTVTDSRTFGSGTLLRTALQAAAMQGENIITFDDALEQADAVELPLQVELKDQTTLAGFNMTLFTPADNDVTAAFYGTNGSRTEFTDFCGNIVCSSQENTEGAALYFEEAVQVSISASGANIYAGVSSFENTDILESMESRSLDELLADSQMKTAIAGSSGDDSIILDSETLVIGNLKLSDGHDTLTITGNSTIYGDIDTGDGDNKITISAGSSIHGNLQGETELCMTLTGSVCDVLFDITGDADSTFENIISITIDSANAEAEEYILFNKGNVETLLEKLQIKGDGGIIAAEDGTIRWSVNDGYTTETEEEDDTPDRIIAAGECVADAEIGEEEQWIFQDGSIASGSLSINENGEVKVMTGAEFIFDISNVSAGNRNGIINNFSGINGTFLFSVNTADDQPGGSYILAENVTDWGFQTPIKVTAGDLTLGSFESEEENTEFSYGENHYSLIYDENRKTLSMVIDSAFRTVISEDNSIELSWHKPVGATGYFVNISRSDETGVIKIFSGENSLNIITAADGEYEWQAIAPGLETEYREGGVFSFGGSPEENSNSIANTESNLYDAGDSDKKIDIFIAQSSGIWDGNYAAQHVELPEDWVDSSRLLTQVALSGKNRYTDIFKGADNDIAQLYLSDSDNGDALFLDDIYSAFPDSGTVERLSNITIICAGNGDDIVDLTSDNFTFSSEDVIIYGGNGDDVIWSGTNATGILFGDKGNDCIIGSRKNDCFIGGSGNDVMHGGGGTDTFAYGDPSTWGNDVIYQLPGDDNKIELFFDQTDLRGKLQENEIENGVRISVAGYENSSITIYGKRYTLQFGNECEMLDTIIERGGCGESASQNIFEDNSKGILA